MVVRIALVKDDDDNNSTLREDDDVLLWCVSKKVAPTTRTFGERGARARGKVPHDDALCLFFVVTNNGKDENAFVLLLKRVCSSMLSSVVDVKKARRRRRSLSLSLLLATTRDLQESSQGALFGTSQKRSAKTKETQREENNLYREECGDVSKKKRGGPFLRPYV